MPHLLLMTAEYPDQISASLISELRSKIIAHGIENQVTLITDFLPDEISLEYLRQASLIVYAYQNTGESSSAAVRMGLASGRPVAVTPIGIFDDVRSSVFLMPGCDAASVAAGIRDALDNLKQCKQSAKKIGVAAGRWVRAHSYSSLARHLFWLVAKPKMTPIKYNLRQPYTLTPESEKLSYCGKFIGLKTTVGKVVDGRIKSTRTAGDLVFGPWVSIAPGSYTASIFGTMGGVGICPARADVVIEAGATPLAHQEVQTPFSDSVLAELPFVVTKHGVKDLEVRFWIADGADIAISSVEISPSALSD